ncbi:NAD(P)-binding protein [Jackrogersella minutella]|nr:NAD(P)-binding protein [Jackrogersella minutella]
MDVITKQMLLSTIATIFTIGIAWIWKLNSTLKQTPPEVLAVSPHRWTEQEVRDTYQRIKANPIDWEKHLPPKLDRRYVITGGSGGVGGTIVLHLLARGQPPESIRIVDFRKPERADMTTGPAALVDFAQTDITSIEATAAAFDKPWPASVAELPLTVFHTAAIIVTSERSMRTYERVKRVNIDGMINTLNASKQAGASVFVSTSSASVAYKPVHYWGNPLRRWPRNYWQAIDESDFDRPLRPHAQFFGNYAHAKAASERIISEANCSGFRTGLVRPANGIYGSSNGDQVVGLCLRSGTFPSWMRNIIQNFVHTGHVSLAHLLFEAALVMNRKEMPKCAGRAFVVTDAGPPPMFDDFYGLLKITAETPVIKIVYLQPAVMLVLAHIVEWFDLASRLPVLRWIVPRPQGDLAILQPAVFSAGTHYLATDAAAQRSVDDGGIGYRPIHDTMEGMCQQVLDWNIEHKGSGRGPLSTGETWTKDINNVGTIPAVSA